MIKIFIPDENHTLKLGAQLAAVCKKNTVIFLHGELGAGKTTFVRGFLQGLGLSGRVKSPTYTLVETYTIADKTIHHFDLYRIQNPQELEFIGINEYFSPDSISLIEWPEKGTGWLPPPDLSCYIGPQQGGRLMRIEATTAQGEHLLEQWQLC